MQISSKEEEQVIETIAAISAIDRKTVRKVFEALAVSASMEAYRGQKEFVFPFIGKIVLDYYDELVSPKVRVKKAKAVDVSLFEGLSSLLGEARQGSFEKVKNFIQDRFKRKLKDVIEQ